MSKRETLVENGTYNKNHGKVKEQRFANDDFYDPQDLAQVKYEMLRTARETERNIDEIAEKFGYSRAAYYKIKASFEERGVSAFVSGKSGPKNARKLTEEHQEFIDRYLAEHPTASSGSIADILHKERGLVINKRTVERYRSSRGRQH